MIGFDRPLASLIDLETTRGDCQGCDHEGIVLARIDGETAIWYCPNCPTENHTDLPTDDPDYDHDRRGEEW